MQLQAIDWVVVAVYGLASLLIGIVFTKRAGRSLEHRPLRVEALALDPGRALLADRLSGARRHQGSVSASRTFVTVALMLLACLMALWLRNAMQAFQILLQIGAGSGLIFLLRWYWWRINAWGEIAAMVLSFLITAYLHFGHARLGFAPLHPTLALVVGVIVTTLGWLAVTLLTPPTDRAVLQSFYDKIRPAPAGWRRAVDTSGGEYAGNIAASFLAWFLGCLFV